MSAIWQTTKLVVCAGALALAVHGPIDAADTNRPLSFLFLVNHDDGSQTIDHRVTGLSFAECDPMQKRVWGAHNYVVGKDSAGRDIPAFDAACVYTARLSAKEKAAPQGRK